MSHQILPTEVVPQEGSVRLLEPPRSLGRWLVGLVLLPLASSLGCTDVAGGAVGEGSDVFSVRVDLEEFFGTGGLGGEGTGGGSAGSGLGGLGGMGGSSAAIEPLPSACTPGLYYVDGLPECFVAEISTAELSCNAPGREVLTRVRENRAREAECEFRGLDPEDCVLWSVCGVTKLTGEDLASCKEGSSEGASGYCVRSREADCPASAESSLFVLGAREKAQALQIFCAVEDR